MAKFNLQYSGGDTLNFGDNIHGELVFNIEDGSSMFLRNAGIYGRM